MLVYWAGGQPGLLLLRAVALKPIHLEAFRVARERFKETCHGFPPTTRKCWGLRLEWLCFWTAWALENTTHPTFANR